MWIENNAEISFPKKKQYCKIYYAKKALFQFHHLEKRKRIKLLSRINYAQHVLICFASPCNLRHNATQSLWYYMVIWGITSFNLHHITRYFLSKHTMQKHQETTDFPLFFTTHWLTAPYQTREKLAYFQPKDFYFRISQPRKGCCQVNSNELLCNFITL